MYRRSVTAMRRRLLTTGQSAEIARVKPATIRQWSSRGVNGQKLRTYRVHDGRKMCNVYEEHDVLKMESLARKHGGGSCANRKHPSQ